jgi:hypothetical protein
MTVDKFLPERSVKYILEALEKLDSQPIHIKHFLSCGVLSYITVLDPSSAKVRTS